MLRSNVDTAKGLVNGSCGWLEDVIRAADNPTRITGLRIQFDGYQGESVVIRRVGKIMVSKSFQSLKQMKIGGVKCSRNQIPVLPSFATTVHKGQGTTVDNVLVSTDFFQDGMAFVALSRCRKLEGLHLMDLHADKFTASTICIEVTYGTLTICRSTTASGPLSIFRPSRFLGVKNRSREERTTRTKKCSSSPRVQNKL